MTTEGTTRAAGAFALLALVGFALTSPPARAQPAPADDEGSGRATWAWPLDDAALAAPFVAPAHEYAPGHRGVDLASASGVTVVRAPDDGVVAFVGTVGDREVVTIDHGVGVVSTLEPVRPVVVAGDRVGRGDVVGELSLGGHAPPGTLHLGARVHGAYVNPLQFLGGTPRAVLLPCC
ncbi:hypothetical protein GCM10022200_06540 [Microbacterium awajiense]|uniref:M23ase beta-sheet core domain-containing protein n=1 Tax=Microbacterium awajiense TaxID=415214 RepID=A0ABP7A815_9MICO